MAKFELIIENEGPLSFVELREIVAIIDDHINQELRYTFWRRHGPFPYYILEDEWAPES
jgi:hypothetical protein